MRLGVVLLTATLLSGCDDAAPDADKDGVPDSRDNCPELENPDQLDLDNDGLGDLCDDDQDGDGFAAGVDCDDRDLASTVELPFYADTDGDGLGDPDTMVMACRQPSGHVAVAGDREPTCATNDTDICGVCGGPGPATFYADLDRDQLGDPASPLKACEAPVRYVDNDDDDDPECGVGKRDDCDVCEGNNRNLDCLGECFGPARLDDCGVCQGPGKSLFYLDADEDGLGDPATAVMACEKPLGHVDNDDDAEPACTTNDSDVCGVCAGDGSDLDCSGVCFGGAYKDSCDLCVGGLTGREPSTRDLDGDGRPDACDQCTNDQHGRFIIQWTAIPPYAPPGGPYTFQIVLWDNGDWAYLYEGVEPYEATTTIGWQGPEGAPVVELAYNTDYVREHRRIFFRPDEGGTPLVDYNVPIEWTDIRMTGERLSMADDTVRAVELPFAFPFAGTNYATAHVAANGFLSFSGVDAGYQNRHLPHVDAGAMMAVFWDDLNPLQSGSVWVRYFPAGCEADCNGDFGGAAIVDRCGVCVYGRSEATTTDHTDCNGDCNGTAFIDSCGECAGGLTGVTPAPEDACDRLPDLIIDQTTLRNSVHMSFVDVGADACLINERCVTGLGVRKVIRFSTMIANIGTGTLRLGRPGPTLPWIWDGCHGHYHYEAYAEYGLYDVTNDLELPVGSKAGFCVMDTMVYDARLAPSGCGGFNCMNQGISIGCADVYQSSLQCQWVDVTDVPDGIYDVTVTTNPDGVIDELNPDNNAATVRVRITGNTLEVVDR